MLSKLCPALRISLNFVLLFFCHCLCTFCYLATDKNGINIVADSEQHCFYWSPYALCLCIPCVPNIPDCCKLWNAQEGSISRHGLLFMIHKLMPYSSTVGEACSDEAYDGDFLLDQ